MKPSFALNLSPDGISLLHRTIRGWLLVGEVALDAPDLADALAYLRATALGLEPKGLTSKLILPGSQVLYTTVEAPGPSGAERRAQIAAALEGQTPYPVKDLVFDWAGTGHEVRVAVAARETLEEAEEFAAQHRFNPLCFVAQPDPEQFPAEPFFGPARAAAALLPEDEQIERDTEVVTIIGRATLPEAGSPDPIADPDAASPPGADDAPTRPASPASGGAGRRPSVLTRDILDDDDARPAKAGAAAESRPEASPTEPDAAATDVAGPDKSGAVKTPGETAGRGARDAAAGRAHSAAGDSPGPDKAAPHPGDRAKAIAGAPAGDRPRDPSASRSGGAASGPSTARNGGDRPVKTPEPGHDGETGPATPEAPATSAAGPLPARNEADALTLFGARRDEPRPGKSRLPRVIAVLVILILLGLAAVMVNAKLSATPGKAGKTSALIPAHPPPRPGGALPPRRGAAAIETPAPLPRPPAPATTIATNLTPAPPAPSTGTGQGARPAGGGGAGDAPALPHDPVTRLVPADTVVQRAPAPLQSPMPQPLGRIGATQGDAGMHQTDTSRLAGVKLAQADAPPPAQPDPPPYGTVFELNAKGLVKATPDGTMNPQGVMVYLGAPKVIPPRRPIVQLAPGTDPALANARPRPRPADLTTTGQATQADGNGTGTDQAAAPKPDAAPAQADISPLAVGTSLVPEHRPADFDKDVKAALAAANAAAPTSDELSDSEPELKAMLRGNPTKASVAKRATVKRALPLNRLALLGVFGPENARQAMLRTAQGKILKVSVGDRLDGGTVSAIGPDALYYRKNGRDLVLKMPKS